MKNLFARALPGLLLLPLFALALGSCDRAEVNAQTQAGAWHIARISTQNGLDPSVVATVTDPGDVSFVATANTTESGRARFYFDKPTGLRGLGVYTGTSLLYTADAHELHRVVLTAERTNAAPLVFVYTLTEATAKRQHWQLIGIDNQDRINYREDWDLERF